MVLMRNGGEYTTSPPRFEMVRKGYPYPSLQAARIHDLEIGADQLVQRVELIVVPTGVRSPGDVPR